MNDSPTPLVSICCITYNQEDYIRQAIDSFLMQETSFPIEIIIHDDASTDNTANIVREYEEVYPEVIRPIYQTENQYSKDRMLPDLSTWRAAKGKYIAICEGDDYWLNPLKLQKQITEMEGHTECNISFHPAVIKWNDGIHDDETICRHSKEGRIFPIEDVIRGGSTFIPTASIVLRSTVLPRISSFFTFSKHYSYGDYYIQVLVAEQGGALFLGDVMSAYQKNVVGSYSDELEKKNPDFLATDAISTLETYREIDEYTDYKYSDHFADQQRYFILHVLLSPTFNDSTVHERVLAYYWENRAISNNVVWNTLFRYPIAVKMLREVKRMKDLWR